MGGLVRTMRLALPVLGAGLAILASPAAVGRTRALAATNPTPGATFSFAAQPADGTSAFFDLGLRPGAGPSSQAIRVVNTSTVPGSVDVLPALGVTAVNTGDSYEVSPSGCRGAACWIAGLPPTVSLVPGQSKNVTFAVRVPPGTQNGQYLAGVVVRAGAPASSEARTANGAGASLHFISEVAIGVAVTVGPRSALSPDLQILDAVQRPGGGVVARINVKNTGNAFLHSAGTLRLRLHDGNTKSFALSGDTVLPSDTAGVDVALGDLPDGSYPASVMLRYWDQPVRTASWSGTLVLGKVSGAFGHTGPPKAAKKPAHGLPTWAMGLMIVLALLSFGGLGLVVGRRSARRAKPSPPQSEPPPPELVGAGTSQRS